jgi:hypothetical protein
LEVHDLAVEQNNGEAILLIKKGSVSYRIFVLSFRLHNRTAGDPQQDNYQFLTLLQPSAAMLFRSTLGRVAASSEGAMRLLEKFDTLMARAGARG